MAFDFSLGGLLGGNDRNWPPRATPAASASETARAARLAGHHGPPRGRTAKGAAWEDDAAEKGPVVEVTGCSASGPGSPRTPGTSRQLWRALRVDPEHATLPASPGRWKPRETPSTPPRRRVPARAGSRQRGRGCRARNALLRLRGEQTTEDTSPVGIGGSRRR